MFWIGTMRHGWMPLAGILDGVVDHRRLAVAEVVIPGGMNPPLRVVDQLHVAHEPVTVVEDAALEGGIEGGVLRQRDVLIIDAAVGDIGRAVGRGGDDAGLGVGAFLRGVQRRGKRDVRRGRPGGRRGRAGGADGERAGKGQGDRHRIAGAQDRTVLHVRFSLWSPLLRPW